MLLIMVWKGGTQYALCSIDQKSFGREQLRGLKTKYFAQFQPMKLEVLTWNHSKDHFSVHQYVFAVWCYIVLESDVLCRFSIGSPS
jgi:hypothetical protein